LSALVGAPGLDTLAGIVTATLAGGALSLVAAALLTFGLVAGLLRSLVSLSAMERGN